MLRRSLSRACRRVGFHDFTSEDFAASRPRRARLLAATPPQTHAPPWKSGASAPRPSIPNATGLQPLWTPFSCQMLQRSLSRACRRVGFHDSTSEDFRSAKTWKGTTSFLPQNRRNRTHHRGRAALQRRVDHPKTNRASAPVDAVRATCCEGACPELAEEWDSTTPPLRTLGAPRPGRARLQSCRKTAATAHTTVEERRFSAASSAPKATGLQPLWTPFSCHMLRRSLSRACRRVGFHDSTSEDFGSATTAKGTTSFLPQDHRNRTHHRGRAALQRRVQRPKSNRASAPVDAVPVPHVAKEPALSLPKGGIPRLHLWGLWERHDEERRDFSRAIRLGFEMARLQAAPLQGCRE
jgi:hypothetical protein